VTVTVRDLFGNVPARRAFLKAQRIESARIGDVVRRYACGRPEVSFSLVFDGRPAFQSAGDGDVRRVLAALHGQGAVESLAPVAGRWQGCELEGVIGTGGPWHSSRGNVCILVNGRWVRGGAVPAAVEAAYRPFAPFRRHPVAVLRFAVPPEQIDANIHPAKLEVRLRDEDAAAEAIREAVAAAFGRSPAGAGASLSLQYRLPLARRRVAEQPSTGYGTGESQPPDLARLRYLTTSSEGLIVAEGGDGLYLVDQHRAHERVIFESLRGGLASRDGQALLEPALLRLTEPESALLAERAADLSALGFTIEDFGSGAMIARAAPAELSGLGADGLVDLLHAALADAAGWRDRLLATAACRAAVKKGEALEPDAARGLLNKLAATESPAVCPHGSPVVVRLADGLLSRLFRW
jgi:DNA mismatch repair protein MutL